MSGLPKILFLFAVLIQLHKHCCHGQSSETEQSMRILTVPSNVKTLQQVMKEQGEDIMGLDHPMLRTDKDNDQVLDVDVDDQDLDTAIGKQSEDLVSQELEGQLRSNDRDFVFGVSQSRVSSKTPVVVSLSPKSKLIAAPGETVYIELFITNYGPDNTFTAVVRELPSSNLNNDAVQFPEDKVNFLTALSDVSPILDTNQTRSITVTMKVPKNARPGVRKLLIVEYQMHGSGRGGRSLKLDQRLFFTVGSVDPSVIDSRPPRCDVTVDTWQRHCPVEYQSDPVCSRRRWTAKIKIRDAETGLRSLKVRPEILYDDQSAHYSYDNFNLGSVHEAPAFIYGGSCCSNTSTIEVIVTDVAGNTATCIAGKRSPDPVRPSFPDQGNGTDVQNPDSPGNNSSNVNNRPEQNIKSAGLSSTVTIVIGVVAGVLLLLLLLAGIAFKVIQNKRKAELAEMRETPQAR